METSLRITLAQINTTVGDVAGNVDRCLAAVSAAREQGSDLVVFPELTLSGYPPEDLLLKPSFLKTCRSALSRFTAEIGDICAVVGTVDGLGPVYNAAAVVYDGTVVNLYRKMHLPNYGVFDEKRYFSRGTEPSAFLLNNVPIGISICEDTWVENGPHCDLAHRYSVSAVLNLSASPFHVGKAGERLELLKKRSLSTNAAFVYVNLVGGQDELVFDGGSMVVDETGTCRVRMVPFSDELVTVDVPFRVPDALPPLPAVVRKDTSRPYIPSAGVHPGQSEDEQVMDALVTGTRDYLRKNGFDRVVIGLSGGIDSTLVAAVACRAVGPDNVIGVTMPSQYTSHGTRTDAGVLADNLGIRLIELPIEQIFHSFIEVLNPVFGKAEADVTEENIQARIRGTLLMALSNKFGWLVLTTGNKSEMATGYCTLYGDMAGGFAVIRDVPKTTVFRLCRLYNEQEQREVIPSSIITRPPSAELRPDQQDSDSLPPYDILDPILEAYIERDLGVEEITAMGYDRDIVRRIIRLVDNAEYKRRQAPPGVKITHRAFGRDRRLPITNRFRP